MAGFSIKEDLEFRPLEQQIEILWISGPHSRDAEFIARVLDLPLEKVLAVVATLKRGKR